MAQEQEGPLIERTADGLEYVTVTNLRPGDMVTLLRGAMLFASPPGPDNDTVYSVEKAAALAMVVAGSHCKQLNGRWWTLVLCDGALGWVTHPWVKPAWT